MVIDTDRATNELSTPLGSDSDNGRGDAGSTRSRNQRASALSAAGTNLDSHLDLEEFTPDFTKPLHGRYIQHLYVVCQRSTYCSLYLSS